MKSFAKHIPHYLVLCGLLLAGFIGLTLFSYDKNFQIAVGVATAASYIAWGTVHHYLHKDLYLEVFIEYVVIAILGFVMLFSLILR